VGVDRGSLIPSGILVEAGMKAEDNPEVPESPEVQRRAYPRFTVDEDASLLLVSHDSWHPCKVVDLSLEGCKVRTREVFRAGTQKNVEINFKINGIAFRLSGTTQWTDGQRAVGIHFRYPTNRRREELAEVLGEVETDRAAKAEREAAEELAQLLATVEVSVEEDAAMAHEPALVEAPAERARTPKPWFAPRSVPKPQPPLQPLLKQVAPSPVQVPIPPTKPSKRERRAFSRQEVDTKADILLINIGCAVHGRIQDLSLGGCRIRTEEPFPVGIYTRVETEFRLEGLAFRLGGVIQGIHNRNLVGIRFLDMSMRKREQVEQLIEEIEMQRAAGEAEAQGGSGESEGL
jgi:hypothetical protein